MEITDEDWKQSLEAAINSARENGFSEIADYISLKSSNDAIRTSGVNWLIDTVLKVVFAFNDRGASIKIEQKENHQFQNERAVLTGSRLKLQRGIRCLTVEAGWTRDPGDGFMRGGALVYARLSHFGFPKSLEELLLLKFEDQPQWFSVDGETHRISFDIRSLRRHFELLLDHNE
jgi:hypothetical protein